MLSDEQDFFDLVLQPLHRHNTYNPNFISFPGYHMLADMDLFAMGNQTWEVPSKTSTDSEEVSVYARGNLFMGVGWDEGTESEMKKRVNRSAN